MDHSHWALANMKFSYWRWGRCMETVYLKHGEIIPSPVSKGFRPWAYMGRMLFITERKVFLLSTTRMQGTGVWACKYLLMRSRSLRLTSLRWPFPGLYNLSLVIHITQDITSISMEIMKGFRQRGMRRGRPQGEITNLVLPPSESEGKWTICISHWVLRRESLLVSTLQLRGRWNCCVSVLKDENVPRGEAAARVRAPSRRTLLIVHNQQILKFPYVAGFRGLC